MINKDKEIGGTHYADMKIEPIELIEAFRLDFIQGNIVKYVSRYRNKNGIEDLRKALDYSRIGMERFDRVTNIDINDRNKLNIRQYCMLNGLNDMENLIITYAITNDFEKCATEIDKLISTMEEKWSRML